jgi:hypothetical protein
MIPLARGVAPFGHPWIKACSRLPRAFRSVPRPSSPPSAKASTRCPSLARPTPRTAPISAARKGQGPSPLSITHAQSCMRARTFTCDAPDALLPGPTPCSRKTQQSDQQPGKALQKRPNPDSQHKRPQTHFVPTPKGPGTNSQFRSAPPKTPPWRRPLETTGIEPVTPCLQSRCSPS